MKKNTSIELTRFLFAIFIALHHSFVIEAHIFGDGWIFTEFFFMVTGYFTTKHFYSNSCDDVKEAFTYTAGKIRDILPVAYIGVFLGFFYYISRLEFFSFDTFYALCQLPLNLLFLYPTKIVKISFCSPLWYMGATMFILPVIILCQIKLTKVYKYLLCYMTPVIGYTCLISKYGTIANWNDGITVTCFIRAACGICLGGVVYFIKDILNLKKSLYILSYLIQILLIALLIFISNSNHDEMFMEAILAEFILLLIDVVRDNSKIFDMNVLYKLAMHLGKLSVPIYCLNITIFSWVRLWADYTHIEWSYTRLTIISMAIIIALSEIYLKYSIKKTNKLISNFFKK